MNFYGFIYITTNKINGKRYLGMSNYHKHNHKSYLGSGVLLKKSIKKYGIENFSREIIYEAKTLEELNEKEIFFINKFNCIADPNWYNIGDGGYAVRGFRGRKHSEETKTKMKVNYKPHDFSDRAKKNQGIAGKNNIKVAHKKNKDFLLTHGHGYDVQPVTVDEVFYPSIKSYAEAKNITYRAAVSWFNRTRKENHKFISFRLDGIVYNSIKDYAIRNNLNYENTRKKIRKLIQTCVDCRIKTAVIFH